MPDSTDDLTTQQVARRLGLAVRSVQLMVDRGELEAWKTAGGHRRIARASVERWERAHGRAGQQPPAAPPAAVAPAAGSTPPATRQPGAGRRILLIEDSVHFQNLIALVVRAAFPGAELQLAGDGITGLAKYGELRPDVLIVDILLPGVDGPTLIATLRSHPQFARSRLIVVTSLDPDQRAPYALALAGVPVVHKPDLVRDLPGLLQAALAAPDGSP